MENEDIPALIREIRQQLDLTQEQSAREVGVAYSIVNQWDHGKWVPRPFLVKRFLEMKREFDEKEGKRPKGKTPR